MVLLLSPSANKYTQGCLKNLPRLRLNTDKSKSRVQGSLRLSEQQQPYSKTELKTAYFRVKYDLI